MALTVSQQPQTITPAYNDQFITCISDQVGSYTDFYYLVQVTIGATTYTDKVYPRPDEYLVYNVKEKAKNHILRELDLDSNTVQFVTDKAIPVQVYILEYYNGTTSGHDSENITYVAWDACYKEDDFLTFDYLDIVNGTSTSLLGSNTLEATYPDSRVTTSQDVWIHLFNNNADNVQLRVYNSSSVLQGTINLAITPSAAEINAVNIGAPTLIANGITPQYGWYVEFEIIDGVSSMFESSYTFNEVCTRFDLYTVYYLKRNGNIGYFHFELQSKAKVNKTTNTVRLNPYRLISGVYTKKSWDRDLNTVSTDLETSITLNTNWITQAQSTALDELFDSPIVWVNDGTGYKAVTITNSEYEYKKHDNETLFQLSIDCKYSEKNTRQRGL